jgi:hypothetical protein
VIPSTRRNNTATFSEIFLNPEIKLGLNFQLPPNCSAKFILKLIYILMPEEDGFYYVDWADCIWSESEGLFRQVGESKEDFCSKVYKTTKKQFLWFD